MSAIPRPMEAVQLQRAPFERRALRNGLLTLGAWAAAIIAGIPLISVLYMLVVRGGARLGWEAVSSLPPAGFEMGGGFGNAIVGTFVMVGIGGLISIPVGVLAAVFLAELGPTRRLSQVARFATKTLTGIPSILAGVFAYAVVVLMTGTYSAPAGGLALAVLMLPTVILTAESAIKAVPEDHARRGLRHGVHAHSGRLEGAPADGDARHPDRRHAGRGPRGRRDGAAAVHRALQQLLALRQRRQAHAAHRLPGRADLQLLPACRSTTRSSSPGRPRWCSC